MKSVCYQLWQFQTNWPRKGEGFPVSGPVRYSEHRRKGPPWSVHKDKQSETTFSWKQCNTIKKAKKTMKLIGSNDSTIRKSFAGDKYLLKTHQNVHKQLKLSFVNTKLPILTHTSLKKTYSKTIQINIRKESLHFWPYNYSYMSPHDKTRNSLSQSQEINSTEWKLCYLMHPSILQLNMSVFFFCHIPRTLEEERIFLNTHSI